MRRLQVDQLHQKMLEFRKIQRIKVSDKGWVNTVRTTLGISLEQLGKKLSLSKSSVSALEKREADGSITLNSLKAAAHALDMELVYGLVPIDGNLDSLIERKAEELATQIVLRASQTMKLEDQETSQIRFQKAIQERTVLLKYEMPKILWD